MTSLKVLTWNIAHRKSLNPLNYVLDAISPDVFILQEAYSPVSKSLSGWNCLWEPKKEGDWGVAIGSKYSLNKLLFDSGPYKGILSGASITVGDRAINIFGVHVPIHRGRSRYTMQEMFSIMDRFLSDGNALVAGDLNFGEYFDHRCPGKTEYKDFLANLLQTHSLTNCYKKLHDKETETFRHPRNKYPECMIDYIFAGKGLESCLKSCEVLNNPEIEKLSDHNPVLAEFEI